MPASSSVALLALLVILAASSTFSTNPAGNGALSNGRLSLTSSSGLTRSLQWLGESQDSDGSYGAFEEHVAATAAYALWLNDSDSVKAALSYSWLATQLNSSSAWFWGIESDVPGVTLYSVASSNHLPLVNSTFVRGQLLQLQNSTTGGFEGYSYCDSDCNTANPRYLTVTSSVDTDMALLGLESSNLIPAQNRTLAIQYLLNLQNQDGSFNLTSTRTHDPIYSLGPDSVSITALTLLALKTDGFTTDNPTISSGLKFLSEALLTFSCANGHVYSTALSALAFKAYDQQYEGATSIVYILSQQNSDGGFSDSSRFSYPRSDALDTGWAAIALETQSLEQGRTPGLINCPPVASFSFSPQAPVVGVTVQFNGSTSHDFDADQLSYIWTFGDGSSADGVNKTHTYAEAGNFTVTLTVIDSGTNPGPLSDTKFLTITIRPTTVQKSPTSPISTTGLWILTGAAGAVVIIGVAYYLGRRSARRSIAPTPANR